MNYKVVFNHPTLKKNFGKILKKIPIEIQDQIMDSVRDLAKDPRPYGVTKIKPPIDIYSFIAQYRIRVNNYRVLYDINDKKRVISIIALRKRNEQTYKR